MGVAKEKSKPNTSRMIGDGAFKAKGSRARRLRPSDLPGDNICWIGERRSTPLRPSGQTKPNPKA